MTINLLKRLESSVQAFRLTLQKLKNNHLGTLSKISDYKKNGEDIRFADLAAAYENAEPDEDDFPEPDDVKIGGKIQISLSDMDLPSWKHALQADLFVIDALLAEMNIIKPAEDAKLQHLKAQIDNKLAAPINPGNKKILIFTAFADTANYLYEHIAASLLQSHQLHTGKVTGGDSPKPTLKQNYDFQSLLTLFSPRSKEKVAIFPNEPGGIDILIGTDCS